MLGGIIASIGIFIVHSCFWLWVRYVSGPINPLLQFYRFAASEVANDAFRSRAISWVMAGGIVAALIGPTLARFGGPLFQHLEYIGSF